MRVNLFPQEQDICLVRLRPGAKKGNLFNNNVMILNNQLQTFKNNLSTYGITERRNNLLLPMRIQWPSLLIFTSKGRRNIGRQKGDRNTKYFHIYALKRRRRNRIVSLNNSQGNTTLDPEEIAQCFINYFKHIFSSTNSANFHNLQGFYAGHPGRVY